MKLKPAEIDRLIGRPAPAEIRVMICFGPDGGLVRERAKKIALTHLGGTDLDGALKELSEAALKEDPALLLDEAQSLSMFADKTVLRCRASGEAITPAVSKFLDWDDGTADLHPLVVEAGDLAPSSGLRKVAESSKRAWAIACYGDTARDLGEVVSEHMREAGYRFDREALDYLLVHLGDDRQQTRNELHKLVLYLDGDPDRPNDQPVSLEEVDAVFAGGRTMTPDRLFEALLKGNYAQMDGLVQEAQAQGIALPALLRSLKGRFWDLLVLVDGTSRGLPMPEALKGLRLNPRHPRARLLQEAAGRLSRPDLVKAIELLLAAELAAKKSGAPEQLLLSRAVFALGQAANRSARRR